MAKNKKKVSSVKCKDASKLRTAKTSQPRNVVILAGGMRSGAGAHKDKKRASKMGISKHKASYRV